jgi:hypothetical protein
MDMKENWSSPLPFTVAGGSRAPLVPGFAVSSANQWDPHALVIGLEPLLLKLGDPLRGFSAAGAGDWMVPDALLLEGADGLWGLGFFPEDPLRDNTLLSPTLNPLISNPPPALVIPTPTMEGRPGETRRGFDPRPAGGQDQAEPPLFLLALLGLGIGGVGLLAWEKWSWVVGSGSKPPVRA